MFDKLKQDVLSKQDHSKKGSIDKAIKPFVDSMNNQKDYFTTSSCSGRIIVIGLTEDSRKDKAEWLFVSHDPVDVDSVWDSIKPKKQLHCWFRMEPVMLHICCRDIEAAFSLLEKVRAAGLKRSGIISKKIATTVEIAGTERINALVAKNGQIVVERGYLSHLIDEANNKLKETRKKLEKIIS